MFLYSGCHPNPSNLFFLLKMYNSLVLSDKISFQLLMLNDHIKLQLRTKDYFSPEKIKLLYKKKLWKDFYKAMNEFVAKLF